ncbi:MAG TPA: prepilin-type N-terminal cleavage/methylation domain-containing protein [Candidatus Limnocylindria bacterium]|nr:prepilin-type N-terminal cleavage/methylation domain-containing protein [Candidatus Limnocylindria bacterium]
MNRASLRRWRGFSLVELLIALALLGSGLLAIAHLEVAVIQRNGAAHDAHLALGVAQTLIERMRDNRLGLEAGAYGDGSHPPEPGPDCTQTACTPDDRAAWDLRQAWAALRATVTVSEGFRGLADPVLRIDCTDEPCGASAPRTVTVAWSTRPGASADASIHLALVP